MRLAVLMMTALLAGPAAAQVQPPPPPRLPPAPTLLPRPTPLSPPAPAPAAPAAPAVAAPTPAAPLAAPPPPAAESTPEQAGLSSQRLAQVMDILNTGVAEGRIAGAVFGIARRGRIVFLQATGYRDAALTEPMRPDAIFPLASMTKPIASVAAMILAERGRLLLTDPVSLHIPAFREVMVATETGETERPRRPILIHDLLRHTAGIAHPLNMPNTPQGRAMAAARVLDPAITLAESVERIARIPLIAHPGTLWSYSASPDVLARVVEVASGMSFERFVALNITQPLRMADTGFSTPATDWPRLAEPRADPLTGQAPPAQDARRHPARIGGSSGLVGTASDYLRFGQMILNGGTLDSVRILGAGTVAHMAADHLGPIRRDSPSGQYLLGPGRGFGLGFAVRLAAGEHPAPGSPGDLDWGGGFGTQFVIDPKQELVAVLMINQLNQFDRYFRLFRVLVHATLTGG